MQTIVVRLSVFSYYLLWLLSSTNYCFSLVGALKFTGLKNGTSKINIPLYLQQTPKTKENIMTQRIILKFKVYLSCQIY